MNVHQFSVEELQTAVRDASELLDELAAAGKRELAMLVLDAMELAMQETMVHVCKGDRARAEKAHRRVMAKHRG